MKKITLIIALLCSISAFSTRYLLQAYGTFATSTWTRAAGSGEVIETLLSTNSLSQWYSGKTATLVAGDEIWFAAGTYNNGGFITLKSDVSMYGGFAGTETSTSQRSKVSGGKAWEFTNLTIMDGGSADKNCFVTTASVNPTYIDGFKITKYYRTSAGTMGVGAKLMDNWIMQNCIVTDNKYTGSTTGSCVGVGVNITGSGQLLNSWIYNNANNKGTSSASANGGGVTMSGKSGALIKGCTIENNTATTTAGGIYCIYATSGSTVNGGGGNIEDCIIRNNTALTGNGGGIRAYTDQMISPLTIKNCQITDNISTAGSGGGLYLDFANATTPQNISIEGCTITGNIASTGGAGLYINNGVYTAIKNCFFEDNKLTADNDGAALYANKAVTVQNCIIANNSVLTGSTSTKNIVRLLIAGSNVYNSTFANNYSGTGSALNLTNLASTVTNCVFWGNIPSATPINGSTLSTLTYNGTDGTVITGATVSNNIVTLNSATNNTFVSPTAFVGASTDATTKAQIATANWRLMDGCPAIDAGTDLTTFGVTTAIDGISRPQGTLFDMGAYERSATGTTGINITESSFSCFSSNQSIHIVGLQIGENVFVYGIAGNLVSNQKAVENSLFIKLQQGVYLVRVANVNKKVIVN